MDQYRKIWGGGARGGPSSPSPGYRSRPFGHQRYCERGISSHLIVLLNVCCHSLSLLAVVVLVVPLTHVVGQQPQTQPASQQPPLHHEIWAHAATACSDTARPADLRLGRRLDALHRLHVLRRGAAAAADVQQDQRHPTPLGMDIQKDSYHTRLDAEPLHSPSIPCERSKRFGGSSS